MRDDVRSVDVFAALLGEIQALRRDFARLQARFAPPADASGLIEAIRGCFPAGCLFLTREVFGAAELDTAVGLALRAELDAARIRSPKQLGKLLLRAGATRVGPVRGGVLWRV